MNTVSPSRRQVLAVAAATVTLPMLDSALGAMRSARAGGGGGAAAAPAATEKAGWFTTTLKPADLKDNQFTAVAGHSVVLLMVLAAGLTMRILGKGRSLVVRCKPVVDGGIR